MSKETFDQFFGDAMASNRQPYDYQRRLAGGDRGTACISQLIDIPTGLGKTAAVVLAWLWNRVRLQNNEWPRRLVYCLPMRTLVEQTEESVEGWLKETGYPEVGIHILMGGEEAGEWDIHPERNAVLIGTQDMLLSRALNRGYGMSRYRWPMHFGLLNNDCLWVLDETQLMGVGVETSSQLNGFRSILKTQGLCRTWWMSATLEQSRLETVDNPAPAEGWPKVELTDAEKTKGRAGDLYTAKKVVDLAPLKLSPATKGKYEKELAELISKRHTPGTLTLVVINRVSRAREVYAALTVSNKTKPPLADSSTVALIHSRFRPKDRKKHEELLFKKKEGIVIATQAIEAGVDVSAKLLISELAPWASMVQRFGRCNRRATEDGTILWIDIEADPKGDLLLPYSNDELAKSRKVLSRLKEASPKALREINVEEEPKVQPVIRKRDLLDLFDTTPDLCGQDLDISRYIRDGEDTDVQFFWRGIAENLHDQKEPTHDELCRVSRGEAQRFLEKDTTRAWRWNPLDELWEKADSARPGAVYMISRDSGGYTELLGWTGDPKDTLERVETGSQAPNSMSRDPLSFKRRWQTIKEHTDAVVAKVGALTNKLGCEPTVANALHTAAQWHDVGKAHSEFQKMLCAGDKSREGGFWAKSENKIGRCERFGFRHELASALAWLLRGLKEAPHRNLIAYIIAAHHGKVRLSIRSLPDERKPPGNDQLFARGIWEGDELPDALGIMNGALKLDLSFMKMGEGPHGPSWLARTIKVRDQFGPFRLAYLETLLRAADAEASKA